MGQLLSDRSIEEVVGELRQIDPPALPIVDRIPLSTGREVLAVSIGTGRSKPYTFKGKSYRRTGSTNQVLTSDEYNRLLMERLHADHRWETEPVDGFEVSQLDVHAIVFTVEEAIRRGRLVDPGTRDPALLLRGLGLSRDGRLMKAAIALFGVGSEMQRDYPQCLLRVAKFKGVDRTEFLDNRQFTGNIFTLLEEAERFLRSSLPIAGRVGAGALARIDDTVYPFVALREALANAFCHRDYSVGGGSVGVAIYDDRLEIASTGTLHFGLTPEVLFQDHESLPWNPLIARVLYLRGMIEQWGRGTIKMAELMDGAGLPRPDIELRAGSVVVTFRSAGYAAPTRVTQNLTDRQRHILELLAVEKWGLSRGHFRRALDPSPKDWELGEDLTYLRQLGLIRTSGHARGAKWFLV